MPYTTYNTHFSNTFTEESELEEYLPGMTTKTTAHSRTKLKAEHKLKIQDYKIQETVQNILCNQINNIIPWSIIMKIAGRIMHLHNMLLQDISTHLFNKFLMHNWQINKNLHTLNDPFNVDKGINLFIDCQKNMSRNLTGQFQSNHQHGFHQSKQQSNYKNQSL